jgi:NTP pyrophosphatase (non-canonical NTP hydrolase)
MDVAQYQQEATRTLLDAPGFDISDDKMMLVWCALGLAGEAGEVVEWIKKGVFHRHGVGREKLKEELGDCLWYISGLCTLMDLDLSSVMRSNIQKLKKRYPEGFTPEDSVRRADVAVNINR